MSDNIDKSKYLLSSLVVLYERLDRLYSIARPRPASVEKMISSMLVRIKKTNRRLKDA